MILVQERHDVAAPDAPLRQGAGKASDALVPLRPRPGAVLERDGFVIGLALRPVGDAVVEVSGFSQVGLDPSLP
jgi:hypothetical protein